MMDFYSSSLISLKSLFICTGAHAGWVNLGWSPNGKMDKIVWEMHAMPRFGLYARVLTAHSLRRNCPKLWCNEWAMGTHACIHSQKESAKLHIACISHTIRAILPVFFFDIAPNLHTLHAPQWKNPNKKGINRKANKQAFYIGISNLMDKNPG